MNEDGNVRSQRVLVTGARGFIGRSVVPRLIAAGCDVIGTATKRFDAHEFGGCELVEWDARTGSIRGIGTVDTVVHLAGLRPSHDLSWTDYHLINTASVATLFPVASARLIYLSTRINWTKEWGWVPKNLYEASKLAGEHLLQALVTGRSKPPGGTIVRVGEVVGGRRNGGLMERLYSETIANAPLLVSQAERDIVHVDVLAEVIVSEVINVSPLSMLRQLEVVPSEPVNLRSVAEIFIAATNSRSTIEFVGDYRACRSQIYSQTEVVETPSSREGLTRLLKEYGHEV